jgi:hypothetical protein
MYDNILIFRILFVNSYCQHPFGTKEPVSQAAEKSIYIW